MPGGYVAGRKFTSETEYKEALEDLRIINRLKAQTNMDDPKSVRKLYASIQSGEIRFKTEVGRDFDDEIYELIEDLEKKEAVRTSKKVDIKGKIASAIPGKKTSSKDNASVKADNKDKKKKQNRSDKDKNGSNADFSDRSSSLEVTAGSDRLGSDRNKPLNTRDEILSIANREIRTRREETSGHSGISGTSSRGRTKSNAKSNDPRMYRSQTDSRSQNQRTMQPDNSQIDAAAKEILRRNALRRNIIIAAAGVIAVLSLGYFTIYSRSAYLAQSEYDELASLKGTDPVSTNIEQKPLFTLAEAEKVPDILDEYKNIYIKNKSVIGWLTIEGTGIDYPVMQTVNNDYYLDHDFNGKEDKNGSIFLDCNCNAMFRSTNLIIYGHHMKSGKMFGNLKKYESEDYCKEHNIIQFDTIYEKGLYEVMYVFRDNIKDAEDVSFKYYQFIDAASPEEFESNMNAMSEMSLYDTGVTATYGDDILTLSTCNGSTSTARFVVVAKRIPSSEVTYVYEKK